MRLQKPLLEAAHVFYVTGCEARSCLRQVLEMLSCCQGRWTAWAHGAAAALARAWSSPVQEQEPQLPQCSSFWLLMLAGEGQDVPANLKHGAADVRWGPANSSNMRWLQAACFRHATEIGSMCPPLMCRVF